jgi:hypothetical protein
MPLAMYINQIHNLYQFFCDLNLNKSLKGSIQKHHYIMHD